MRQRWFGGMVVTLFAVMLLASSALAGHKLLCITKKGLKGQETVSSCLAKGEEFAIIDDYGVVHILSPREVELTKAFNPQLFEQQAYSIQYQELAPELKIFGVTVRPAQPKK